MNEEKAARFQRLGRQARVWGVLLAGGLLVFLVPGGFSARLRDLSVLLTSSPAGAPSTVALYALILALLFRAATFPVAYYRTFILERRFGLSTEPLTAWFSGYLKATSILLGTAVAASVTIYAGIQLWPRWWWVPVAATFGAVLVAAARAGGIFLLRLFHRVEPLTRPRLRTRLLALSSRAGVSVEDVLVIHLGAGTTRATAALVGLGRARRIVLSDTLLESFSEAEIEVVLAHEIGHRIHHDVLRIVALEICLVTGALAAGATCLTLAWAPLGLSGPGDVAGLPVLATGALALSSAVRPALHAFSRRFERRADRFALALTNHPSAFISTMKRFAVQNLAEERPSRMTLWMFHSHPAFAERIRLAEEYQAKAGR